MKIALYYGHHSLPFWSNEPSNPLEIFNPVSIGLYLRNYFKEETNDEKANSHWVWPILVGISKIELPYLAHVSVFFDSKTKTYYYDKRVWVQFSTLPEAVENDGIPIIVESGKLAIKNLWLADNATYSPLEFISKEDDHNADKADFWSKFFTDQLRSSKEEADATLKKAKEKCDLYEALA